MPRVVEFVGSDGARRFAEGTAEAPRRRRLLSAGVAASLVVLLAATLVMIGSTYGMVPALLVFHAATLSLLTWFFFKRRWAVPHQALIESARRVAGGDLEVKVDLGKGSDLAQLADAFNSMTDALRERTESLSCKVDELTALYDMSRVLASTLELDALLGSTLDAAMRVFSVDTGYVVLRDAATGELELRVWRGSAASTPSDHAVRSSMSEWVVRQGRPLIFNPPQGRGDSATVDAMTGAVAAVCAPLIGADGVIGAIAVGSLDRHMRFTGEDVRVLSTIANHVTVAIGNTELFASLQDAYLATVRSLAAAVDAKDSYMRGHSERVAMLALAAAEQLEFSPHQRTALEMASYLHDIGKIGISEQILRKPGPLDHEEASTMRHHPLIGANILRPVAFPWAIAPIVRHHHERYDGSGYPAGLRGEEIPMLARVLCVADAYEAMTAERPYRQNLTAERAVEELRRCAGSHFDPRAVEALVGALQAMDAASCGPDRHLAEVEPQEARAVFVAVFDGMLVSFRRLGGARLASNLEASMSEWMDERAPAFSLASGRVSVVWSAVGDAEAQSDAMRAVIRKLGGLMEVVTGRNLVDHFYGEAVEALTERLRQTAQQLALYRHA